MHDLKTRVSQVSPECHNQVLDSSFTDIHVIRFRGLGFRA